MKYTFTFIAENLEDPYSMPFEVTTTAGNQFAAQDQFFALLQEKWKLKRMSDITEHKEAPVANEDMRGACCASINCVKPATTWASVHEGVDADAYCDYHATEVRQSISAEYLATCPHCGCGFGVN